MTVPSFAWRSIMSNPLPTLEGVFAIHKPPAITSAQVLRDLQGHLNPSKTFAPWIESERQKRDLELSTQRTKKSRRQRQPIQVKMGHGGTLDPMATGVLIVGVGNGTKSLQGFLDGTKTYDATLLFGAATDTYDRLGKVVKRAPFEHITRPMVEEALAKFRGDIMQRPPIFSALRVQGKRLYEYAREGKEVPVEIQERPVTVSELEILEWYEPGTHEYNFPEQEAEQEEKDVVDKILHLDEGIKTETDAKPELKRKRGDGEESGPEIEPKKVKAVEGEALDQTETPSADTNSKNVSTSAPSADAKVENTSDSASSEAVQQSKPCPAPAARIRMTVSSGFYVRSLCHDLGAAVGSLGFMTSLQRTRQSEFEVGKNVLEYDQLALGEDVWGPKIIAMLEQWDTNHPDGYARQSQPAKRQHGSAPKAKAERVRNSSSPEA